MTTILCTLYNSLYLDKGLVLYDSLCKCAKDFKLYVLCMDEKCYEILTDLHQEYHIPVKLSDIEAGDDALLEAKSNRSMGEYCWTCSSSFIRYVLKHYREESCTYIDADMYFYHEPQVLIDGMLDAGKSVMVVPHRFPDHNKELANKVGIYCVEFNTFLNTPESLEVLEYWRERCLECCSNIGDGIHWGDQKYLEELVEKFNCVYECENFGAGVAPWNIELYAKNNGNNLAILYKPADLIIQLIFFHYQSITYISSNRVNTSIPRNNGIIDYQLVYNLYYAYLSSIEQKKEFIRRRYDIDLYITSHPSRHKNKYLIMRLIMRIVNKIQTHFYNKSSYVIRLK